MSMGGIRDPGTKKVFSFPALCTREVIKWFSTGSTADQLLLEGSLYPPGGGGASLSLAVEILAEPPGGGPPAAPEEIEIPPGEV